MPASNSPEDSTGVWRSQSTWPTPSRLRITATPRITLNAGAPGNVMVRLWDVGPGGTSVVAEDLPGPGSVFLRTAWNFLAPVRPGDRITAEVEVLERHASKPVVRVRTTVTNSAGVVVLDGDAHVYREPVDPPAATTGRRR